MWSMIEWESNVQDLYYRCAKWSMNSSVPSQVKHTVMLMVCCLCFVVLLMLLLLSVAAWLLSWFLFPACHRN